MSGIAQNTILKNTYEIRFRDLEDIDDHFDDKKIIMHVERINGKIPAMSPGHISIKSFENSPTTTMISLYEYYPKWREIVGEKDTHTIHEYLDKQTGKPVLQLYPTGEIVYFTKVKNLETVATSQLNMASCKDLVHVLNNIHNKISEFKRKNK